MPKQTAKTNNNYFAFKDKLVLTFTREDLADLPKAVINSCLKPKKSIIQPLNANEKKLLSLLLVSKGIDLKGDIADYVDEIAKIDKNLAHRIVHGGEETVSKVFSAGEFKKLILKTFTNAK